MAQGRMRRMPAERATDILASLLYGTVFLNYFNYFRRGGRSKPKQQAVELLNVCGLSWLMCGCPVGPNYHAPQTAVEPSFGPDSLHATITTGPTVLTTS